MIPELKPMGSALTALRKQLPERTTQKMLAEKAGFNPSKVALVESGTRALRPDDLDAWAQALNVDALPLRRLQRAFAGYLSSPTTGEYWWRDIASEEERTNFSGPPPSGLTEEELERYPQERGDEWWEYSEKRYQTVIKELAKNVFDPIGAQVEIFEIQSTFGGEHEMEIRLPATRHRKSVSVIRLEVGPPLSSPVDMARWMHKNLPGKPETLAMLQEIMNPQELERVTAFAIDLVDRRERLRVSRP